MGEGVLVCQLGKIFCSIHCCMICIITRYKTIFNNCNCHYLLPFANRIKISFMTGYAEGARLLKWTLSTQLCQGGLHQTTTLAPGIVLAIRQIAHYADLKCIK